jgi:hypothetical protein
MTNKKNREGSAGSYWRYTLGIFLEKLIEIEDNLRTDVALADIRTHDLSDGILRFPAGIKLLVPPQLRFRLLRITSPEFTAELGVAFCLWQSVPT